VRGVLVLLGTLASVALAGPATADVLPGPCAPSPETGCIAGTFRTSAGTPAEGVRLDVTGPAGTATATTDADGRWSVAVTEAGDYTVALDVASIPPGEQLRDPTTTSRTVTVTLGSQAGALFPLGAPPAAPATPSPSAETTAAVGDAEVAGAPETPVAAPGGNRVAQQLANGIVFGLLLALASVGLSLVHGTTGLSSFSHGEQVTLGAIVAYVGVRMLGMPLAAATVLAVVVGAASGWLQDAGIWSRLRRRRVGLTQQMIVTIGLAMALQYTFQALLGGGRLRIQTSSSTPVRIGPAVLSQQTLVSAGIALAVLGGVAAFLLFTRTGRAARAVSDNPALAAASGIGVERVIRTVWTGAAGLAALGGVLTGLYFQATTWNMGATVLLLMFAAVTLGGLGTAFGALVGSLVIGLVSEMASLVVPSDLRFAGALAILILVLLVRPQGVLGRRERVG
jgi:branched-chain amino acid transport system permease protein